MLADLKRVASQLNQTTLSHTRFADAGRYSCTTICRRFGSWKTALKLVNLQPAHLMNVTQAELIADMQRVAASLGTTHLRFNAYIAHGNYSRKVINRLFGRWASAAEAAGLTPVIHRPQSRQELFDNLKAVWQSLGRRPRYADLRPPVSKFGASAYTRRFGTFRKAIAAFLASPVESPVQSAQDVQVNKCSDEDRSRGFARRTPRTINLRLRFMVLRRDCFRCCACGRSPANDPRVVLQIDHKRPWSDGGETVLENLHTLCRDCNYGKSDLPWENAVHPPRPPRRTLSPNSPRDLSVRHEVAQDQRMRDPPEELTVHLGSHRSIAVGQPAVVKPPGQVRRKDG